MRREYGRKKSPVATANVGEGLEAPEVIGSKHRSGGPARKRRHRPVKNRALVGVGGAVRPHVSAMNVPEGILAGLNAVQQFGPGLPAVRATDKRNPGGD